MAHYLRIMLAILFWFITFYFLYKFMFEFVVPLIGATKNLRTKMDDLSQNQQRFESFESRENKKDNFSAKTHNNSSSKGDYIDFEEIK